MATFSKLLAIILLLQLSSALATAVGSSTEDCHQSLTVVIVGSYSGHIDCVFQNPTQSTQAKILSRQPPEGLPAVAKTVCTRWRGTCSFVSKMFTSFQYHVNKKGKQMDKASSHLGYRSTTLRKLSSDDTMKLVKDSYQSRASALFGMNSSPSGALVDLPPESYLPVKASPTELSSKKTSPTTQATGKALTAQIKRAARFLRNLSSSHHATTKFARDTAISSSGLASFSSQKSLPLKRPGTPTALSAIPLYRGRMASWKFRRSFSGSSQPRSDIPIRLHVADDVRRAPLQRSPHFRNI